MNTRSKYNFILLVLLPVGSIFLLFILYFVSKYYEELGVILSLLIFVWGFIIKYILDNIECPNCGKFISGSKDLGRSSDKEKKVLIIIGKKCQHCGFKFIDEKK